MICATLLSACFGDDDSTGNGAAADAGAGPGATSSESGVATSKGIGAFSDAERLQYCQWEVAQDGAGVEVPCSENRLRTVGHATTSECIEEFRWTPECTATILNLEACLQAGLREPCNDNTQTRPECTWVDECFPDGPDN